MRNYIIYFIIGLTLFIEQGVGLIASADDEQTAVVELTSLLSVRYTESFTAELTVKNVANLDTVYAVLTYDAKVLKITQEDVTKGELVPPQAKFAVNTETAGKIRIIIDMPDEDAVSGEGIIARFRFTAIEESGSSMLILSEVQLGDNTAKRIPVRVEPPLSVKVMPHRGVLVSIKADNEVGGELIQIENNWYVGFTASVDVEDAEKLEDLGIAYVVLTYDPEVLEIDKNHSVKPGELLPHDATFISNTKVDGKITIVINTQGVKKDSSSKSIANITFKVIRQGFSNLTLSQVSLGDTTGKEILSTKATPLRVDVDPDPIEIEVVEVNTDSVPQKEGQTIMVTVYETSQIATEGFFNIGPKITGIPLEYNGMTGGNNAAKNRIWTGQYTIEKCDDFIGPVTAILKNAIRSSEPKDSETEITIDTMPPSLPEKPIHTDDDKNGDYDNDIQLAFSWSAAKDEIGIDHYNIDIFKDDSKYETKETQYTNCIVTGEDGHAYKIKVEAVDKAENVSEAVESDAIKVVIPHKCECTVSITSGDGTDDNTAKIGDKLSINVKITAGIIKNIEEVTVDLTPICGPADEPLSQKEQEKVYFLDYQIKECEEHKVDEDVILTATIKDIVGNIKQWSCTAKVDLTPPQIYSPVKVTIKNVDDDNQIADIGDEVEISLEASNDDFETVSVDLGDEIVLKAIGDEDDDSLHLTWDVKLKKYTGNFKVITGNVDTSKTDSIDMKDLCISVKDNAGNRVETTAAIPIDATKPSIDSVNVEVIVDDNQIANIGDKIEIVVKASHGDGETVFVDLSVIGGGQEELPLDRIEQNIGYYQTTFEVQAGNVDNSNVEFPVLVKDNAGNTSEKNSNQISVYTIPPFIEITVTDDDGNQFANIGDTVIITAIVGANRYDVEIMTVNNVSVLNGQKEEVKLQKLSDEDYIWQAKIPVKEEGNTDNCAVFFTITATDSVGNQTQKQSPKPISVYSIPCPIEASAKVQNPQKKIQNPEKPLGIGYEIIVELKACEEAQKAFFKIETLEKEIIMQETKPGEYFGSYTVCLGDEAQNASISVSLVDKGGRKYESKVLHESEVLKITLDGIKPSAPDGPIHKDYDANEGYDNDNQLDFDWEDDNIGITHYNVYLSKDGNEYKPYKPENPPITPQCQITGEDGHTYKIKVEAVDKAGNVGEPVESDSIKVITPPEYTVSIIPNDKTFKIGDELSVSVEITQGRIEDIEGIDKPVTIDLTPIGGRQDEPLHYDGNNIYSLSYPLNKEYNIPNRTVSFNITVKDIAGNVRTCLNTANVDLMPPKIEPVDVNDDNQIANIGGNIEVMVNVTGNDIETVWADLSAVGCAQKEELPREGTSSIYGKRFEVKHGTVDSPETKFPVYAIDYAGNQSESYATANVDAIAPILEDISVYIEHVDDDNQVVDLADIVTITVAVRASDGVINSNDYDVTRVIVDARILNGQPEVELSCHGTDVGDRYCVLYTASIEMTVGGNRSNNNAFLIVTATDDVNNSTTKFEPIPISVCEITVHPGIDTALKIGETLTVTLKGGAGAKDASFDIVTFKTNLLLKENNSGEYSGSYIVEENDHVVDTIIIGRLVDKGESCTQKSPILDGILPEPRGDPIHKDDANEGYDNDTQLKFCWTEATDNIGIDHYNVYISKDDSEYELYSQVKDTCCTVIGENGSEKYRIKVEAEDIAGNVGGASESKVVTMDTEPPSRPGIPIHYDDNAKKGFDDDTEVDFRWKASEDNIGIDYYNVYIYIAQDWCKIEEIMCSNKECLRGGEVHYTVPGEYGHSYRIKVEAVDLAGTVGKYSEESAIITVRKSIPQVIIEKIDEDSPFIYSEKKEGKFYLYYGDGMKEQEDFEVWVNVEDEDGSEESECSGSPFAKDEAKYDRYRPQSPNFKLKYSEITSYTTDEGKLTITVTDNEGFTGEATIEVIRDVTPPDKPNLCKRGRTEIRAILKDDESGIDPNSIKIKFNNETDHYSDNMRYDEENGVLSFFCPEQSQNGIYLLEIEVQDMVGNRNIYSGYFNYGEPNLQVYNYPNPFKPGDGESDGTHFVCEIDRRAKISIKIFTVDGRFVNTLDVGECEPGIPKEEHWNGKDRHGNEVSDVFVCYVTADCNGKKIGKFHKILAWK